MAITEEALAQLMEGAGPVQVELGPGYAFILIAQLQLALRHPGNTGIPAGIAREVINGLRMQLPVAAQPLIDMGFDPQFDERYQPTDYTEWV